jgi:arabinofuranan 3-O-arabinosyltransferase
LLLFAGFWGIVRLAEALGVGSRSSRIVAGVAFALAPRVLTTLGSISSESLPMMLAPWVLVPLVRVFSGTKQNYRVAAASSAVAVALMGAVNAVATAAATLVAVIWWISYRPNTSWRRFTMWWIPCLLLATLWWIVPLLLLGGVSPPFLDYIESSGTTTEWTSLTEVLRGAGSWTPFVSPERIAGAVLVTQPAAVVATGAIAAAGLAGLCMRAMPARGRLAIVLVLGLVGMGVGYVGGLGSPVGESVRTFLDGTGAPLRNVHKLEPLVRIPLVLGLAHLLARVPMPGSVPATRWRRAFAHPEREPRVALTSLVLVALLVSTSLAWTGKLAPRGAYEDVPDYWTSAAQWLQQNTSADPAQQARALVVPGAPLAAQVWGLTRDEPLQALATTPWAVRDAVPLVPPGAIRALDSVQRLFADGRPSDGLADTLLGQNVRYLVLRNDLDAEVSRSTRPALVHQSVDNSPGLTKVAEFGDELGPRHIDGIVADADLRPRYPAIEIYAVRSLTDSGVTGPYTVDASSVPRVRGGPEVAARLNEERARGGLNPVPAGPILLDGDAAAAGLPVDDVLVTDTPVDRETDYGQVDNHSSSIRATDDPRRTLNLVPDYPVEREPLVSGNWSGAHITVSSAASDATQLGGSAPGSGPPATVDSDRATSWLSNGLEAAVGQWLQLDLDKPITSGLLRLTTSAAAIGSPVKWLEISTPNGTTAARIGAPGEPVTVSLPGGETPWVRITATQTENGSGGAQFGISELSLDDYSNFDNPVPVVIRHHTVLPAAPSGAHVTGWDLAQELPGRAGCIDTPDRVRCANGIALEPEELGTFERTLNVPDGTAVTPELWVRPRQSPSLQSLVTEPNRPVVQGDSAVGDLRGSAYALTDGDPRTAWTASSDSIEARAGTQPTVTITLPAPTLVTGLDITQSIGDLPAHPTRVAVNLGTGPQVREVGPDTSTVSLTPAVTSTIVLSIVAWDEVLDQTALGFAQQQPPGLAEVAVRSGDSVTTPIAPDPNRVVTLGCGFGPTLTIAGQLTRTAIITTAEKLLSGSPIRATICAGDTPVAADVSNPVPLPRGEQEVTVDPGPSFFVDSVHLRTAPLKAAAAPGPQPIAAPASTWSADERRVAIDESTTDRILVVPESTNSGWVATDSAGARLTPVVVSGWQQGWIVPAGTSGQITMTYPADKWYRLGIFGGLVLLLPLLLLASIRRERTSNDEPPRPWRSRIVGGMMTLGGAWALSGLVGVGVAVALLASIEVVRRRWGHAAAAKSLVALAGLSFAGAAALLSKGPWRSVDGYIGHSALIQFCALVAVLCVASVALPDFRRASQRANATRAGSSTKA